MQTITISTREKDEIMDLTGTVERFLQDAADDDGICVVFAAHTTCAVTTADLDPSTDLDLLQALRSLLPQMQYRHPHNPEHAPDHLLSSLLGPSVTVPYANRRLLLGTWQRIVLVELDGPRQRSLHLSTM